MEIEISKVFFDSFTAPLQDRIKPSPSQLTEFLVEDLTNTIQYHGEDFPCVHYANMLSLHARAKKFQMSVLWVYGCDTETHEPFSHALNQITTTQGLATIDPQTDIWWYAVQHEIRVGEDFLFWYFDPPHNVHIDAIVPIGLP